MQNKHQNEKKSTKLKHAKKRFNNMKIRLNTNKQHNNKCETCSIKKGVYTSCEHLIC